MPGKGRDFGYTSCFEDEDGEITLSFTSYEKNGSVNRYTDNGDGGHSHQHWNNHESYEEEDDPNWEREESDGHDNPDEKDVKGGCYLTAACMAHYKEDFDDNCFELQVLRMFRDAMVPKEEVAHYYKVAPTIVNNIEKEKHSEKMFDRIYRCVVEPCVKDIVNSDYKRAYIRYKKTIVAFENKYAKQENLSKINNDESISDENTSS